jgi:hypothetical protein
MEVFLQGSPQKQKLPELDPTVEEAMQSALENQSILLDMFHSTTARRLPPGAVEFSRAETKNSASQLEAHVQAALVNQFPKNGDIIDQSWCKVADKSRRKYP